MNEGWSEQERKDAARINALRAALELIASGGLQTDHRYWSVSGAAKEQIARARGIAEAALAADSQAATPQ